MPGIKPSLSDWDTAAAFHVSYTNRLKLISYVKHSRSSETGGCFHRTEHSQIPPDFNSSALPLSFCLWWEWSSCCCDGNSPSNPCNHTYFSLQLASGTKVAPRFHMWGGGCRAGPQSMFPSIMVSVAHFVSVGVLAQRSAHSGFQLLHWWSGVWVGCQHV